MNEKIDLVSLPKKSFWKLSIPIIAFCIFDAIYGIVDMLWVSRLSVEATFALGISIPIVSLIFAFGDSIGQGTNSIMSRFIGSGDYESAYNALIHGMIASNIVWVFIVLCLLFAQGVVFYLDKADSYIMVFDYLVPIIIFSYIFLFINLFSETMQAEGNSDIPTVLIISSNVLNIILDPIFIFYLDMGIQGAAYATVLSAFLVLIIFFYLYLSGRTKVPLSPKYFKFRIYILVEIFKVALPNLLNDGLWCFLASFINSTLILTMGQNGPILYSIANKIKTLLIAPVRGYGRGLMSVTGHLFGAEKFDELNEMFKYVLKISLITTLVVVVVFDIFRNQIFGLFSVTGLETEIWYIAVYGTFIMILMPVSMIAAKMLDGFGKSYYSLAFTVIKIISSVLIIYGLSVVMHDGRCVLIGLLGSEAISTIIYYVFLKYLFNNFDRKYGDRGVVKTFGNPKPQFNESIKEGGRKKPLIMKLPLFFAQIAMLCTVISIFCIPLKLEMYSTFMSGVIALIVGAISIYLMKKLHRPMLSVIGFISVAIVIFVFMGENGYLPTIFFVITGVLILYIKLVHKKLKKYYQNI